MQINIALLVQNYFKQSNKIKLTYEPGGNILQTLKAIKIRWYANDYSKGRSLCKLDSPASHTNLN